MKFLFVIFVLILCTMLTRTTMNFIHWAFEHGSFLRILPYKWNKSKLRIEHLNSRSDYFIWNLTDACFSAYILYITLGLLTSFPFDGLEVNNSTIILHVLVILTSMFASSISLFRRLKRKEIVDLNTRSMVFVQGFECKRYVEHVHRGT